MLRLLINVAEVSTEHQKWLKICTKKNNSSFFLPEEQKKPRPKPSAGARRYGPRSGLYLLVRVIHSSFIVLAIWTVIKFEFRRFETVFPTTVNLYAQTFVEPSELCLIKTYFNIKFYLLAWIKQIHTFHVKSVKQSS